MKKGLQLIILFLISTVTLSLAQVSEEEKAMSMGINNAIIVEIPETNEKMAEKVWKDFMKEYGKTKRNRKSDEWTTEDASISAFNDSEPVNIYAQIQGGDDYVELAMWVPLTEGFLSSSSHPEAYRAAEKMLNDYALEVKIETVKEELEEEEKTLSKLERDLKKLKKDNEDYHETIRDSERAIEKAEKDLVQNKEDQEKALINLRAAEDVFEEESDSLNMLLREATTKDEEKALKKQLKAEQKKVKSAKSKRKKEEKEEDKLYRTIDSSKKKIEKAKNDIVANEKDQREKEREIEKQIGVVKGVKERLNKLYSYR